MYRSPTAPSPDSPATQASSTSQGDGAGGRGPPELPSADETRARLAAIVDSSDDAIVSKTLQGIVTSWNAAAERLFGWTAAEAIGRPIHILIPPDRLQEERHILARITRGERVEHFETVRMRKDGRLVDISLTVSPVRDATGRIIGASKIARDITEARRQRQERLELLERERQARQLAETMAATLEARVRERTRSLEEMVRELDTFASTVAHDLRAPLRAVHSFGQLLLEEASGKLTDDERAYLNHMINAGARMDALIQDLLAYSRISRGELVLDTVDLDDVVRDAARDVAAEVPDAEIIVEGALPAVNGHEVTLRQAVLNLLRNAVKFVDADVAPRVVIRAERSERYVRLWVVDNGIGIAPAYHHRLFRMFERLHARDVYPGTGMGLAIVRRAVERMGGQAGLESDAGQGSRFFLDLVPATAGRG